jgi:hypothetical protein
LKPPGFNPRAYKVISWFFKVCCTIKWVNLDRYTAGYAAQATAALMGRGAAVERCDVAAAAAEEGGGGEVGATGSASCAAAAATEQEQQQREEEDALQQEPGAAAPTQPRTKNTPPTPAEVYWLGGAAVLAPVGAAAAAHTSLAAAAAAAPAYLCVTFAVYLLCRRIPPKLQRLGGALHVESSLPITHNL